MVIFQHFSSGLDKIFIHLAIIKNKNPADLLTGKNREIIVAFVGHTRLADIPGIWFDPGARRALEIARQAKIGPAILPGNR